MWLRKDFLLNIRDRSYNPCFNSGEFFKSIPPRRATELGDRHTLRKVVLRKRNLEVRGGVWEPDNGLKGSHITSGESSTGSGHP